MVSDKISEKEIEIGIGINSGPVVLGTLGVDDRLEGTVIGDAVNIAARLESLSKIYKAPLLISGNTFKSLKESKVSGLLNDIRLIDKVEVKGKSESIDVFEVFSWEEDEIREIKRLTKDKFKEAISAIQKGSLQSARKTFSSMHEIIESDGPLRYHLKKFS